MVIQMSSYDALAASYDELMADVEYRRRADALARQFRRSPIPVETVLDLACGTGTIACPLCREKYGSTNGKYQEREGGPLAAELLRDSGLPQAIADRVVYLVAHHHTPEGTDGPDYQILLEADYLVNADESGWSREAVRHARESLFRTETGRALLDAIYLRD